MQRKPSAVDGGTGGTISSSSLMLPFDALPGLLSSRNINPSKLNCNELFSVLVDDSVLFAVAWARRHLAPPVAEPCRVNGRATSKLSVTLWSAGKAGLAKGVDGLHSRGKNEPERPLETPSLCKAACPACMLSSHGKDIVHDSIAACVQDCMPFVSRAQPMPVDEGLSCGQRNLASANNGEDQDAHYCLHCS